MLRDWTIDISEKAQFGVFYPSSYWFHEHLTVVVQFGPEMKVTKQIKTSFSKAYVSDHGDLFLLAKAKLIDQHDQEYHVLNFPWTSVDVCDVQFEQVPHGPPHIYCLVKLGFQSKVLVCYPHSCNVVLTRKTKQETKHQYDWQWCETHWRMQTLCYRSHYNQKIHRRFHLREIIDDSHSIISSYDSANRVWFLDETSSELQTIGLSKNESKEPKEKKSWLIPDNLLTNHETVFCAIPFANHMIISELVGDNPCESRLHLVKWFDKEAQKLAFCSCIMPSITKPNYLSQLLYTSK